jgi:PAS domain S-box-containing protein
MWTDISQDAGRLASPDRFGMADPASEGDHATILSLAVQSLRLPIGGITVLDGERLWFLAHAGLGPSTGPSQAAFSETVIHSAAPLVVHDCWQNPVHAASPSVTGAPYLRFFAGVPLTLSGGETVGCFAVGDIVPHPGFDDDALARLVALARLAVNRLELARQARRRDYMMVRAGIIERLLSVAAEATDFPAAIASATMVLLDATQAQFCHVYQARDGSGPRFIGGAESGHLGDPEHLAHLRGRTLGGGPSIVGQALETDRQVIRRAAMASDATTSPASRPDSDLDAAEAMAVQQIVTPFRLLDLRYAFSIGFVQAHPELDTLARLTAEATAGLRPLLRRFQDEETARLFRRAVEASSDPILITEAEPFDEPGPRIVFANAAFERHSGYSLADIIGRTPRLLSGPGTSAEGRAAIRAALAQWRPVRQELLNYRKDGTPFHVEINIAPVADSTGWFTHWISVQRDVTEQRAQERSREAAAAELRALIAVMPGALLRVRVGPKGGLGRVTYVAPSIEALTGYTVAEVMQPDWYRMHLNVADAADIMAKRHHAAIQGEATCEFRFRHRSGRDMLIHARIRSIASDDGGSENLSLWSDVTQEHETRAMLTQAAKMAQLGELATGMAHELNQPLAAVSLAAENALRSLSRLPASAERVRGKLETITDMARRASSIIDHMRVFGRVSAGERSLLSLQDLVADTIRLVGARLRDCGVRLEADLPERLPYVVAQAVPLEQVLINLITNACDAYAAAGPRVDGGRRIIALQASEVEGLLEISVQDHAGGIAPEALHRVFQPFFTTKAAGQGTGLGLSISYGIITEFGGTITAENREGGARFVIMLPCVQKEELLF